MSHEYQNKSLNDIHTLLWQERNKLFILSQYGEDYKAEEIEACKNTINDILAELRKREGDREQ